MTPLTGFVFRRAKLVLCAVGAIACSTSSNSGSVSACASYAQAVRDGSNACGRTQVAPEREDEYYQRIEKRCESEMKAPESGLTAEVIEKCVPRLRENCGDTFACEDLTCVSEARVGDGQTCDDGDANMRCEVGLYCDAGSAPTGVCRTFASEGEACRVGLCKPGLVCALSRCVKPLTEGEKCDGALECAKGLECEAGTCARITWGLAGAACDEASYLTKRCLRGSCNRAGVCVDPLPDGAACDVNKIDAEQCGELSECTNGTCQLAMHTRCY
jgi:hypothetical protein